jgi:hypothetical protein
MNYRKYISILNSSAVLWQRVVSTNLVKMSFMLEGVHTGSLFFPKKILAS